LRRDIFLSGPDDIIQ